MATSGSTDYNLTRNDIINMSLTLLCAKGAEDDITNSDLDFGTNMLNMMLKSWEAAGCMIWSNQEATLFLDTDSNNYTIGGTSSSNVADTVIETTLTDDAAAAATSIVVDDISNMSVDDNIGIVLASTSIQWTTVTSIVGPTVHLDDALTDDAAAGNRIYSYTSTVDRPYDITQVRIRTDGDTDRLMTKLSRSEYFALANKTIAGSPNSYYYDPQLTSASLYIWPQPSSVNERIKFTYRRPVQDFDNPEDDPDMPQEWLLAIVYNLALILAPAYGAGPKMQEIAPLAGEYYRIAKQFNIDSGSSYYGPKGLSF